MNAGRIIRTVACVAEGAAWLAAREPGFARVLEVAGPLPLRRHADGFGALMEAIVGQQVSVASARAMLARLQAAGLMERAAMAAAPDEVLRAAGLSRQKARYGRALAQSDLDFAALRGLADAEVIGRLVALPGIGRWTAEIYAMFALGEVVSGEEAARIGLANRALPAAGVDEAALSAARSVTGGT